MGKTWRYFPLSFVQEHELQTKENSLNTDALKQEIADMAKEKSEVEGKISELR